MKDKNNFTDNEYRELAKAMLIDTLAGRITTQMIDRTAGVLKTMINNILEQRTKQKDDYSYMIPEEELRQIFEQQHHGRNLRRSHRGTYQSPPIAAIWNQHLFTARAIEKLIRSRVACYTTTQEAPQ